MPRYPNVLTVYFQILILANNALFLVSILCHLYAPSILAPSPSVNPPPPFFLIPVQILIVFPALGADRYPSPFPLPSTPSIHFHPRDTLMMTFSFSSC
jgi:hypothetical protein